MKPEIQKIKLTPWHGGECPVDLDITVVVKKRNGRVVAANASAFRWNHSLMDFINNHEDVIAYAVIETEVIEPPHSTIVPQAVWDVLPEWVTCTLTDEFNNVFACKNNPLNKDGWARPTEFINITEYKGVIPAKCQWQDSLVYRPGSEPK